MYENETNIGRRVFLHLLYRIAHHFVFLSGKKKKSRGQTRTTNEKKAEEEEKKKKYTVKIEEEKNAKLRRCSLLFIDRINSLG